MSSEDNKTNLIRYAQEVWNGGDLAAIEQYITPDYVRHDPGLPMPVRAPEGVRQLVAMYRVAFPDLHLTSEVMLAEGDKVAALWHARGTHRGELMGMPATDKAIAITAIEIFRFVDGKIAEQWVLIDNLSLLQQLGVVPMPGLKPNEFGLTRSTTSA